MTADARRTDPVALPAVTPEERAEAAAVGAASFVLALRSRGIGDVRILRAMELVPREVFAPRRFADLARTDVSLPLPCGQTMTAPGTVASLLVLLAVREGHRILEIGTGSGYVTALLAQLGAEVVSVERFGTLTQAASEHLRVAGAPARIRLETGDGLAQRPRERFDRILLNGSVPAVPEPVLNLLGPGGRLVGALATEGGTRVVRADRDGEGALRQELLAPVRLAALIPGVARSL
jgi:protein-L-isoaspartate(D-aspartate) O-methyltransferase